MALGNGLRLPSITSTRLVLLFSLALVALYNLATWKALGTLITLQGAHKLAFLASFGLFLWAAITLLLTLVSFRWTLKPAHVARHSVTTVS